MEKKFTMSEQKRMESQNVKTEFEKMIINKYIKSQEDMFKILEKYQEYELLTLICLALNKKIISMTKKYLKTLKED